MFERFTDRARRVLTLTQVEARLLNHNYIGTEHILLGLLREGEGVAGKTLESLGISLEAVRMQVEEIIGWGQATPTGSVPFTPRAKKVLELSLRESIALDHEYIGTEHILLGLIREGEGVAAQVLVKLGATLEAVRERALEILSQGHPEVDEPVGEHIWTGRSPSVPPSRAVRRGAQGGVSAIAVRSSYPRASRWLMLGAAAAATITGVVGAVLFPGDGAGRVLIAGGGTSLGLLIAAFALRIEAVPRSARAIRRIVRREEVD